jgi:hypothetical protein
MSRTERAASASRLAPLVDRLGAPCSGTASLLGAVLGIPSFPITLVFAFVFVLVLVREQGKRRLSAPKSAHGQRTVQPGTGGLSTPIRRPNVRESEEGMRPAGIASSGSLGAQVDRNGSM